MNVSCEVIKDLLPLYYDSACSEESKKLVDGHIADCEGCREYLNALGESEYTAADGQDSAAGKKIIKSLKKREKKKIITTAVTVLALALVIWVVRAVFIVKETPVEYYDGMLNVKVVPKGDSGCQLLVYPAERYRYNNHGCTTEIMLDGKQVTAKFFYYTDNLWEGMFPSRELTSNDEHNYWGAGEGWIDEDGTEHIESIGALFYLVPDGFDYGDLYSTKYPDLYTQKAILIWKAED